MSICFTKTILNIRILDTICILGRKHIYSWINSCKFAYGGVINLQTNYSKPNRASTITMRNAPEIELSQAGLHLGRANAKEMRSSSCCRRCTARACACSWKVTICVCDNTLEQIKQYSCGTLALPPVFTIRPIVCGNFSHTYNKRCMGEY